MHCNSLMQYNSLLFWQRNRSNLSWPWNWNVGLYWQFIFCHRLPECLSCRSPEFEDSFQFYVLSLCTNRQINWLSGRYWSRERTCTIIMASFSCHIYAMSLLRWSQKAVSFEHSTTDDGWRFEFCSFLMICTLNAKSDPEAGCQHWSCLVSILQGCDSFVTTFTKFNMWETAWIIYNKCSWDLSRYQESYLWTAKSLLPVLLSLLSTTIRMSIFVSQSLLMIIPIVRIANCSNVLWESSWYCCE